MAVDQRKRQRKLARRAKKQKAQRKAIARQNSQGIAGQLRQAASAPILHCLTITDCNTPFGKETGQLFPDTAMPIACNRPAKRECLTDASTM